MGFSDGSDPTVDRRVQRDPLVVEGGPYRLYNRAHHVCQVDAREIQPQPPADDLRGVEEIVDQLCLRPGIALDCRQRPVLLLVLQRPLRQHLGVPVDRSQRCSQLVRDRHEELVLQVGRRNSLAARALQAGARRPRLVVSVVKATATSVMTIPSVGSSGDRNTPRASSHHSIAPHDKRSRVRAVRPPQTMPIRAIASATPRLAPTTISASTINACSGCR